MIIKDKPKYNIRDVSGKFFRPMNFHQKSSQPEIAADTLIKLKGLINVLIEYHYFRLRNRTEMNTVTSNNYTQ